MFLANIHLTGEVAEWLNALVLKTRMSERASRVRIPPSPHLTANTRNLKTIMRFLGIDYGTKRIGISTSDDEGRLAFPRLVLENNNKTIENLKSLIVEENIKTVVIGESKNYKMEDNEIMTDIYDLKKILEMELNIDVELHPEVLTSVQAEKMQGKNDMLDASAAAIILQSYLDSLC